MLLKMASTTHSDQVQITDTTWGVLVSMTERLSSVVLDKTADSAPAEPPRGSEADANQSNKSGYLLGRNRECDIVIPNIPMVSNRHCLIYKESIISSDRSTHGTCVFIKDLSTNGTFVNGVRIPKNQRHQLHHGDTIQLAVYDASKKGAAFDDQFYIFRLPKGEKSAGIEETLRGKFVVNRKLGSGSFATVYEATHRKTGKRYAIKVISKGKNAKAKVLESLEAEISILMSLSHPCIISIYDVYNSQKDVCIILELVKGGELFNRIVQETRFSEDNARKVMFQLFAALKYLHDREISHRDLKPENVLLVSKDANDMRIKLSDFGLAKLIGEQNFMKTLCGTPNYVAPEVLTHAAGRSYTKAVDLWSCGVILYICLVGFPPFSEELAPPRMTDQIKLGKYAFPSPWWDSISPEAIDLVKGLLTVDPAQRLTTDQALEHPWMKKLCLDHTQDPFIAAVANATAPAQMTRGDTINPVDQQTNQDLGDQAADDGLNISYFRDDIVPASSDLHEHRSISLVSSGHRGGDLDARVMDESSGQTHLSAGMNTIHFSPNTAAPIPASDPDGVDTERVSIDIASPDALRVESVVSATQSRPNVARKKGRGRANAPQPRTVHVADSMDASTRQAQRPPSTQPEPSINEEFVPATPNSQEDDIGPRRSKRLKHKSSISSTHRANRDSPY
ncbi:kinase-like domain-containing protein [Polychytrium aggregatum]|uniref:kinase-like domain-containing protein n=1 Tax=Polychytrium aggregatum TaxID=110093 RepID=UPI0022FEF99D|nr:kinase-like domain-containing protein [Polychytrium aggregatum]KAI9197305.1 kinase-like domain-containing protein [Polychytrium aggregatum]